MAYIKRRRNKSGYINYCTVGVNEKLIITNSKNLMGVFVQIDNLGNIKISEFRKSERSSYKKSTLTYIEPGSFGFKREKEKTVQ